MQVSEADRVAQPASRVEPEQQQQQQEGLHHPGGPQPTPTPLTSYEVNTLLYNYLQETGLSHSAFAVRQESGLDSAVSTNGTKLLDLQVPQNHLIRLLHKGLLYVEAEARWRGEDTQERPPRLLGYDIQDHLPITRLIQATPLPEVQAPMPFQQPQNPQTSLSSSSQDFRKVASPQTSFQSFPSPSAAAETSVAESHKSSKSPPLTTFPAPTNRRSPSPPAKRRGSDSKRPNGSGSPAAVGAASHPRPSSSTASINNSSAHVVGAQPSVTHASSLQLDLPPLASCSDAEASLKRKDRSPGEPLSRKTSQAMDIDPPQQESARVAKETSAEASLDRRRTDPGQDSHHHHAKESRDTKRPKLDPATFPPPPSATALQSSLSAKPEAFSPSISNANSLKSPIPLTPSASVPPVSVVTVRTVQTSSNNKTQHQQHQHSQQQSLGHSQGASSHVGPNGRRRSISPNVSTKLPSQKEVQRPESAHQSRAASPEVQRKRPSSSSSVPATSNGPSHSSKKGPTRAKTTGMNGLHHQKSRDHSPVSTGKAEQSASVPLHKGRGKSPSRGEVPARDCITLRGHTQCVTPCNWNPKVATKLATGAVDSTARVWAVSLAGEHTDDETSVVKHVTGNKKLEITVVAWNPDGTLLATGSEDGIVRIWTPAGELCLVLSMHQRSINSIKWHKSGTMLLSASLDSSVILWELSTGRVRQQFETHTESVMDCDWFDEQHFASCSMDKTIHLCTINRSVALHRLRGHQDEVNVVQFDPTKALLASCSDDRTVRIWSMKSYFPNAPALAGKGDQAIDENGGVFILTGHTNDVHTIAWDPLSGSDGRPRILASGSFDSTARVWDADKGQCLFVLDRCAETVYGLSFSPLDGRYLALGSNDGRVCVYRVKDGELLYEYKHMGPVYETQWHPTLPYVAVTGQSPDVRVVPFRITDGGDASGTTNSHQVKAEGSAQT